MLVPTSRSSLVRGLLGVALLSLVSTTPCWAQDISKWPAGEFTGPIRNIQGNLIIGENFAKEPIGILISPALKAVSVKGTAELDALKTGMFVRFGGKVDETGTVAEKVSELFVFTQDGPLPELEANVDGDIVGKVTSNDRKGKLILATNGKVRRVTFELAESPKISVDVRDLGLARFGDTIQVTGKQNKVGDKHQPNQIIAESIVVDLVEPLSGSKKPKKIDKKGAEKPNPFEAGAKDAEKKEGDKKEPEKKEPAKKEPAKKAPAK